MLQAVISSRKKNPTSSHYILIVELYLQIKDRTGSSQSLLLRGTKPEILARIQSSLPPSALARAQKLINILFDEEIYHASQGGGVSAPRTAATKPISAFRIRPSSAFSVLELLSTVTPLSWRDGTWQQERLLFDHLSSPRLLDVEVTESSQGKDTLFNLELFLRSHTSKERAKCPSGRVGFIMSSPLVIIHGTLIQRLHESISWKALRPFLAGYSSVQITHEEYIAWLQEVEDDDELGEGMSISLPETGSTEARAPQSAKHIQGPNPVLRLHDTRGMVSSLFMEYSLPGERSPRLVAMISEEVLFPFMHAGKTESWRNIEQEKSWEKDLLDCGYTKELSEDGLRYFCSAENVQEALEMVLGIGWRVLDNSGRPVYLLAKASFEIDSHASHYVLRSSYEIEGKSSSIADSASSLLAALHTEKKGAGSPLLTVGSFSLFLSEKHRNALEDIAHEIEISPSGTCLLRREKIGILPQDSGLSSPVHVTLPQEELQEENVRHCPIPFQGLLRPYQEEGVSWLLQQSQRGRSSLLADEMGLGKTVQCLAWISRLEPQSPVLIVAPKALLFNWQREIERFLPSCRAFLFHGEDRMKILQEIKNGAHSPSILLTSFTTLRIDIDSLRSLDFSALIVDEAQYVKNSESQAYQALISISARHTILMTGTPIENSMADVWSHFGLLEPRLFGPKESFLLPFTTGSSQLVQRALARVRKLIAPYVLRRTKHMVATDLPEIIDQVVWVEMEEEQKGRYLSFVASVRQGLVLKSQLDASSKKRVRMEMLEAILRLRQIACHHMLFQWEGVSAQDRSTAKWNVFFDDLETLVSEGKKIVVFSQFSSMIDLLYHEAASHRKWSSLLYHGGITGTSIEKVVDRFQNDESVSILFTTLKSGGVGLNLTKADAVLLYDPWWNTAIEQQAISRAHRIGREGHIIVKRYITKDSIEERVVQIGEAKKELFQSLFESPDIEEDLQSTSSFDDILEELVHMEISRTS